MKTNWMRIVIGGLSGIALVAPPAHGADLQPLLVKIVRGELNIQQSIPSACGGMLGQSTPVTNGRIEVAPADGIDVPGGKRFVLTRASISFAPFSITPSCPGHSETHNFSDVGVQLGQAVAFTATPSAVAGVFNATIPKDDVLIADGSIVDGQSDSHYKHPKADLTGSINLVNHTITRSVVIGTRIRVDVPAIGGDFAGTMTVTLLGTRILPDADFDGIPDSQDHCPLVANPDQKPVPSPIVTAPPDVTIASCADRGIGYATAKDVCGGGPVVVTSSASDASGAPGSFRPGPNLVTWIAMDATGRYGTAPQTVSVADTTPPAFALVPPAVTINNCGAANLVVPNAVDDCSGPVTITNDAPASFGLGTTLVTWTAADTAGNQTTATQTVSVTDRAAPKVACLSVADPSGLSGAGYFRVAAADSCTASPAIRLGSYALAQSEIIQVVQSPTAGVRVVIGKDRLKHFTSAGART